MSFVGDHALHLYVHIVSRRATSVNPIHLKTLQKVLHCTQAPAHARAHRPPSRPKRLVLSQLPQRALLHANCQLLQELAFALPLQWCVVPFTIRPHPIRPCRSKKRAQSRCHGKQASPSPFAITM